MNKNQIIVNNSRAFFESKKTLGYKFRLNYLKKLRKNLIKYDEQIFEALKKDLNKSRVESFFTEYKVVLDELNYTIKNLKDWIRPETKKVSPLHFGGRIKVYSEPYGVVLIISPWNYPFNLTFLPLIGALASGNTCVIKLSKKSKYTSKIIKKIISETFEYSYVNVVSLDYEQIDELWSARFDYIFFTGSSETGKKVMQKASKHLTPMTLELGGKSPCIVDKSADIKMSAKKILFGKLINAGQTCIAPDYVLVHKSVKNRLMYELVTQERSMIGNMEYFRRNYPKIINESQFDRLDEIIKGENLVYISDFKDEKNHQYPFTIVEEPKLDSKIMQTEIFAPILPIISFDDEDEVINIVKSKQKPLALYLFTGDKKFKNRIINEVSFGGGCINDTIMHVVGHNQAFGGVGYSGMGQYHGKASFDTFSHKKSIYSASRFFDLSLRYHPYDKPLHKLIKYI